MQRNEVTIMATKPEFLVIKKEMLVALLIASSLVTISATILSLGMAIRILCLGYVCMQPSKSKGLKWPFLYFSGGLL